MEIESNIARPLAPQATHAPQSTPDPAPDLEQVNDAKPVNEAKPVSDVKAVQSDPTPEVPLPIPATSTQTGFVSAAVFKTSEATAKLDSSAVSPAERTLKPYGISMLPEKADETVSQTPNQPKNE